MWKERNGPAKASDLSSTRVVYRKNENAYRALRKMIVKRTGLA